MIRRRPARPLFFLLLLVTMPGQAFAQWSANGNAICVYTGEQSYPANCADGAGGAYIVWHDYRAGSSDLYLQRVTGIGTTAPGWPVNGLGICTAVNDQKSPVLAPDGSGGVFIAWEDYRAGGADANVYTQRITSSGAVAAGWPVNGIALCTAAAAQGYPVLAVESGSIIVVWQDDRSGVSSDIYAQRVNGSGVVQWTANGVAVCTLAANQVLPAVVGDRAGGAITAWQDGRDGNADVYAQRLNASGAAQWAADGVALCAAVKDQLTPRLVADGSGGAIAVWDDYRAPNSDIYAQRVNGSGATQWTDDGVALCTDLAEQYSAAPVPDGAGGAIVPWIDYRGGSGDVYAQRVTTAGMIAPGWAANGASVCVAAGEQSDVVAAPDGLGGAIFAWDDARTVASALDLYAVRLTSAGWVGSGWTAGGTLVCDAVNNQNRPATTSDASGSVILSWYDERNGAPDIYAKRLATGGSVDVPPFPAGGLDLSPPAPNPMRNTTTLRFDLAVAAPLRLEILDLAGRIVRVLADEPSLPAGAHWRSWDGRDAKGGLAPPGLYFVAFRSGATVEVRKLTRLR